ncbi:MAG TPA: hypothetical protein VE291_12290 [Terracidiphilus sp.]|nr:hypothetical protein [Terracidiphilus sp.]
MPTVFEKLNLKNQTEIVVLDAPESFVPALAGLREVTIHRSLRAAGDVDFFLAFVTRRDQVDVLAPQVARRAQGDAIVWFAYPKGTSKKYKCDFNRDTGWDALKQLGFDTVRAVAIDEDWTALRFRRTEFIKVSKSATRSF